ncbi:unnamed protein product [Dracunculus medinensis]|uniref:Uncharacterized protein n=1 Tax=Dracunculus medinensis TaxID=318479 RepID=A0A0N4U7Y9_DRAME|nr:unnamed protein product [Dracunculus medinensis]
MGQTLERMKKYSNSMSQVDREGDGDDNIKESTEEHYQRSYKEVLLENFQKNESLYQVLNGHEMDGK